LNVACASFAPVECGLPLSSAVRLALPIKGRFFYQGYACAVVGRRRSLRKSKVELPVRQSLTALGSGKPRQLPDFACAVADFDGIISHLSCRHERK
jgi:hypothetical protein